MKLEGTMKQYTTNNRLFKIANELGLNQTELALKIGKKRTWVHDIFKQRYELKYSHLESICEILGYEHNR